MSNDKNEDEIREALGEFEEDTIVLEKQVGPNMQAVLTANGLIRVAFGFDLLSAAFYCDADFARATAQQLVRAADAADKAWEELQNQTSLELPRPTNAIPVLQLEAFSESPLEDTADSESNVEFDEDEPVPEDVVEEFDAAVVDAIEVSENGERYN